MRARTASSRRSWSASAWAIAVRAYFTGTASLSNRMSQSISKSSGSSSNQRATIHELPSLSYTSKETDRPRQGPIQLNLVTFILTRPRDLLLVPVAALLLGGCTSQARSSAPGRTSKTVPTAAPGPTSSSTPTSSATAADSCPDVDIRSQSSDLASDVMVAGTGCDTAAAIVKGGPDIGQPEFGKAYTSGGFTCMTTGEAQLPGGGMSGWPYVCADGTGAMISFTRHA